MKRLCESSADRITDLPADLIQRILVCLPIKDAAKTSILSRNWRHRWRSIPELVFGDDFSDTIDEVESECKVMTKQVMFNIHKCLLLHDGPITKFVLSIPGLCTCREMDLIILYLSNKGVQHFTFKLIHLNYDDEAIDFYQMHSSLFSALHLKSLTLGHCVLTPPPWFDGFRKLTHLGLDSVKLPSDFFENFLPKCPMLESLSLFCIYCEVLDGKLEIMAPLLKSFSCVGSFLDICFKSTPLLSDVELDLDDGGKPDSDMVSLFASLPALQKFHSGSVGDMLKFFARADTVLTRLATPLHLLEVLKIEDLRFDGSGMERGFVCLIMSSPNLRRLTVQVDWGMLNDPPTSNEVGTIRRLLEAEVRTGSSDCLQHLREFRIGFCCGTQGELDLMRFVLATAPLLRLIHIRPWYRLGIEKVTKLMKEVTQYKCVSKDAEVIFDSKC